MSLQNLTHSPNDIFHIQGTIRNRGLHRDPWKLIKLEK